MVSALVGVMTLRNNVALSVPGKEKNLPISFVKIGGEVFFRFRKQRPSFSPVTLTSSTCSLPSGRFSTRLVVSPFSRGVVLSWGEFFFAFLYDVFYRNFIPCPGARPNVLHIPLFHIHTPDHTHTNTYTFSFHVLFTRTCIHTSTPAPSLST